MKRSYLDAGAAYTASQVQKNNLDKAIKDLKWFKMTNLSSVPDWTREALQPVIAETGVNVDRIGHCDTLFGRYTLLAIRNNFDTGEFRRVTLYFVDGGHEVICLALDMETEDEVQLKNYLAGITDAVSLFAATSVSYQPSTPIS